SGRSDKSLLPDSSHSNVKSDVGKEESNSDNENGSGVDIADFVKVEHNTNSDSNNDDDVATDGFPLLYQSKSSQK
ncbi:hypothetical protein SK128_007000, partial [Halocaridina rubra]